ERYGITREKADIYRWMEESFQQSIKGDREPMYEELKRIGAGEKSLKDMLSAAKKSSADTAAEVFAYIEGSYHRVEDKDIEIRTFPGQICSYEVRVRVSVGCKEIRLDPAEAPGLLLVESVTDQDGNRLGFTTNGCKKLSVSGILYDTDDPMLMVSVGEKERTVIIRYQYDVLTADMGDLAGRAGEERRNRLLMQRVRCAAGTEKIAVISNDLNICNIRRSLNEDNVLFIWGYYPYENEGGRGITAELGGRRMPFEVITSPIRLSRSDIPREHMLDMRLRLPDEYDRDGELIIRQGVGEDSKKIFSVPVGELDTRMIISIDDVIDRQDMVIVLGYAVGPGEISVRAGIGQKRECEADLRRVSRFEINQEITELSRDAKVGFELRVKKPGEGSIYPIRLDFECEGEEKSRIINEEDFAAPPPPTKWQKLMHYGRRSVEVMQSDGIGEVIRKARRKLSARNVRKLSEYEKWIERNTPDKAEYERQRKESESFSEGPLFSIVVPVYHTDSDQLTALIESVTAQTNGRWELCLADAGSDGGEQSTLTGLVGAYSISEPRIKYEILPGNGGISENTNAAIGMSSGDYIVFVDHDDLIEPETLYECAKRIITDPSVDVIYTDQDMIDESGEHRYEPVMKPDFSIDLLRTRNYISHLFVAKRSLVDEVGLLDKAYDGSQDYDFTLRCVEKARNVCHIPKVLYHWRQTGASTADDPGAKTYAYEAGKKAIEAHYERLGIKASVEMTDIYGVYRTTYHYDDKPLVSIIIPNKDHRDDLSRCINSVTEKEEYENYEIIIVENNSEQPDIFDYYESIETDDRINVVKYRGEFNFSAINNLGAQSARGEYLLFMNNDIEEIDGRLITEMLNHARRPDVGVVGARLYYENETIQHAGLIVGYGGLAGHAFLGFDRTRYGSLDRIVCTQDYSAVTAACLMTRADIFRNVGGFSEELAVAYNDVDYCLKVRRTGKLVVYTPYAVAYHYESSSRGYEDTPEKRARYDNEARIFKGRWRHILDAGDPYYNPNLSLLKDDFSLKLE
ncbi:MAG: glycosyltransferase family 2 protein, partial [Lachnospiraceae bacterium]|nr:glycosyltransferase family 2 protein [Lachnospiraceae bacterium]